MDPIFSWDEFEIAKREAERRMQQDHEAYQSEEEALQSVYNDYDFWEWEWEWLVGHIRKWMAVNDYHAFHVDAKNVGWRNATGWNEFTTDSGVEFLEMVVGYNNATFKFYEHEPEQTPIGPAGVVLTGTVWHHDSPAGEKREVWLMRTCDVCGLGTDPEKMALAEVKNPYGAPDTWALCQECLEKALIDGDVVEIKAGHIADYNKPRVSKINTGG
jgi:hypothetical protein